MNAQKEKLELLVRYNPDLMVRMSEIVRKLDLGIDEVVDIQSEVVSFFTTTKIDDLYIETMINKLKQVYEDNGCSRVEITLITKQVD